MINKSSVHLQDFPDLAFIPSERELMAIMDLVRQVCSVALFIRDKQNLRVRLPLNKLTIIGKNAAKLLDFSDIIADEVNVKNVATAENLSDFAEFKLQIDFRKLGTKFGAKMKEISAAVNKGQWQRDGENVVLAGEVLQKDEYEIKLITKNQNSIAPLPGNDYLVELDLTVTQELEEEGMARDLVRLIQQHRKQADFNVSDHIKIKIYSDSIQIITMIKNYENYIKEQTLADIIEVVSVQPDYFATALTYQLVYEIEGKKMGFEIDLN